MEGMLRKVVAHGLPNFRFGGIAKVEHPRRRRDVGYCLQIEHEDCLLGH